MKSSQRALVLVLATAGASAQADPLYAFPLFEVGDTPEGVVSGDVDGDGHMDLVSTQRVADTVAVLLGRGDGTFDVALTVPAADKPTAPHVVDLDGDGRVDLVAASPPLGAVLVWLGEGDGDLQPFSSHAAGAGTVWVESGDADGDGAPDVFAANPDADTFSLLRGNGGGGLLPATPFGVYDQPVCVAAADLDLDGDLDAVTANAGFPATLTVRLGDGAGSFGPKNTFLADPVEQFGCRFVEPDDTDGDGMADLVVSVSGGVQPHLDVLLGVGGGAFGPPVAAPAPAAGTVLTLTDMNGDGRRDVVQAAGSFDDPSALVRLADGAGSFVTGPLVPIAAEAAALAAGDFDGDDQPDVAFAHGVADRVSLLRGDGAGALHAPPTFAVPPLLDLEPRAMDLADMDRDGDPDAVAIESTFATSDLTVSVTVLPATAGSFGAPIVSVVVPAVNGFTYRGAALGDLDGDDAAEIAMLLDTPTVVPPFLGGLVRVMHNDGAATLSPASDLSLGPTSGSLIALGDVDGDGDLDAAVSVKAEFVVRLCLNDGSAQLSLGEAYSNVNWPTTMLLTDVNLDGAADLVRSSGWQHDLDVRLADGQGGLLGVIAVPNILIDAESLAVADFDGDGLPDLAWSEADSHGGAVRLAAGGGNGSFAPLPLDPNLREGGFDVAVSDLDLDGQLDLAYAIFAEQTTSLVLADAGTLVAAGRHFGDCSGDGPRAGDLDGDGHPELVGAHFFDPAGVSLLQPAPPDAWTDLGLPLAGTAGPPRLTGLGTLLGSEPITLKISDGPPLAPATLVIGAGPLFAPLKGGTLVPQPTLLVFGLPLDAFGHFAASGPWFGGLPSGTDTFFQAWIPDSGGPKGFAATNALRATTP
ncbi:MAG TPA: VCBS repeat-containing protein [Planctomycetota bacterium]|nr:VCBS repeat-containing protein [Planctomycetota bacterium]